MKDKLVMGFEEASGSFILKYDVKAENLTIRNAKTFSDVEVQQIESDEGYRGVFA